MTTARSLILILLGAAMLPGCLADRLNHGALHPRAEFRLLPADLGLTPAVFTVPVEGAVLDAWLFAAPRSRTTVLVCGGNTGNKQLYLPLAARLVRAGVSVVLWDYRGFGLSTGEPDLWSLVPDGVAVLRAVRRRRGADRIALLGISLGSVVALGTATEERDGVDAVVVEGLVNPGGQLDAQVGAFLGALTAPFLVPASWDVRAAAAELPMPILFIHGTEDGVTPLAQAAPIFACARRAAAPREFWIAAGAGHAPGIAGRYGDEYVNRIRRFLRRRLGGAPPPADAGPVPVEVATLYPDRPPDIYRTWSVMPVDPAAAPPLPPGALFVSRNVPAVAVRPAPDGFVRVDAYQESRARSDAVAAEVYEEIGLGRVFRFRGHPAFFRTGPEPDRAELLAGCADAERRLAAATEQPFDPLVRPSLAEPWDELAGRWDRLGEGARALAAWKRYLELVPDDPFAWWRFDDAGWRLGFPLERTADVLDRMAELAGDADAARDYRRRAARCRERLAARASRVAAWTVAQRAARDAGGDAVVPPGGLSRTPRADPRCTRCEHHRAPARGNLGGKGGR